MRRSTITVKSIVLVVLFGAIVATWIVSYHKPTIWEWSEIHWEGTTLHVRIRQIIWADGEFVVSGDELQLGIPPAKAAAVERSWRERYPPYRRRPMHGSPRPFYSRGTSFMGLGYWRDRRPVWSSWGLAVPFWLPALLCAISPARLMMRRWVAVDRDRRGMCHRCGYDLRSSPGRCPECGSVPDSHALAPDCGPAVVAVATSSATKGLALLTAYAVAAIFVPLLTVWAWNAPTFALAVSLGLAIAFVVLGGFHAAGYTRSPEAFFTFGCLGGLLLFPVYIWLGRHLPPAFQVTLSMACVAAVGFLARECAVVRWRLQDRQAAN